MASDMDKPDGLTIIPYGREKEILAPLPIRRLWGVGAATERRLTEAGFRTIGDIQRAAPGAVEMAVGSQAALLRALADGIDDRPVRPVREVKSIGDEETYEHDLTDTAEIRRRIAIHSDVVARRLRKKHLAARTVSLKVRFSSFLTVMRSLSFEEATNLQEDIEEAALRLLERGSGAPHRRDLLESLAGDRFSFSFPRPADGPAESGPRGGCHSGEIRGDCHPQRLLSGRK